jgi:ribonuclease P protein subunit POP4
MKAAATITQSELIGLDARVAKSTNRDSVGILGKVIDETRNTLVIRQNNSDKIVPKETTIFQFTLPNGSVVEVEGNAIMGRPEDRVKKKPRRQW